MTWTDTDNQVADLRNKLQIGFPGATMMQSRVMTTTLLRIITPKQLFKNVTQEIDDVCTNSSAKVSPVAMVWSLAWLWLRCILTPLPGSQIPLGSRVLRRC